MKQGLHGWLQVEALEAERAQQASLAADLLGQLTAQQECNGTLEKVRALGLLASWPGMAVEQPRGSSIVHGKHA